MSLSADDQRRAYERELGAAAAARQVLEARIAAARKKGCRCARPVVEAGRHAADCPAAPRGSGMPWLQR